MPGHTPYVHDVRDTPSLRKVITELMAHPSGIHGYAIARSINMSTSYVYQILSKLTHLGWVECYWMSNESVTQRTVNGHYKRLPRKCYELTAYGQSIVQTRGLYDVHL